MFDHTPVPRPRVPLWESLAAILAIASLWPPYILQWEGIIWHVLALVMLAVMVVVLVRRVLAFERAKAEARRAQPKGNSQGRAKQ